jgi:hypothetical protein
MSCSLTGASANTCNRNESFPFGFLIGNPLSPDDGGAGVGVTNGVEVGSGDVPADIAGGGGSVDAASNSGEFGEIGDISVGKASSGIAVFIADGLAVEVLFWLI